MIYNMCIECGHSIKTRKPSDFLAPVLRNSKTAVCKTCDNKSGWKRCSTAEAVKNTRYTFTVLSKDEIEKRKI